MVARPTEIATHMRALDPIIARARFIIESFIQNVTPLNMHPEKTTQETRPPPTTTTFETVSPVHLLALSLVSPLSQHKFLVAITYCLE